MATSSRLTQEEFEMMVVRVWYKCALPCVLATLFIVLAPLLTLPSTVKLANVDSPMRILLRKSE